MTAGSQHGKWAVLDPNQSQTAEGEVGLVLGMWTEGQPGRWSPGQRQTGLQQ